MTGEFFGKSTKAPTANFQADPIMLIFACGNSFSEFGPKRMDERKSLFCARFLCAIQWEESA
jgi:hypothetical protein